MGPKIIRPSQTFKRIVFENVFDGKVTGYYGGQSGKVLGRVLKPVTGSGRFGGSTYIGPGLLRANHPGVICVSTGPVGKPGGFQIVPAVHASPQRRGGGLGRVPKDDTSR